MDSGLDLHASANSSRASLAGIDDVVIRPARREDVCDELLYMSAAPYYDVYAGSQERARRILRALWPRERHNASYEVCRVAERDGQLLGVAAGFPIEQGERLANRFVVLSFPRIPIWRWPTVLAHLRAAGRVAPAHPLRVWYVDALAVAPEARRAGVARALLDDAVAQARAVGLAGRRARHGAQQQVGAQAVREQRL